MSVKLPLIVKRQVQPSSKKKSEAAEQEELIHEEQAQQEPDYDQQFEQQPHKDSQQGVETITVLKKEEPPPTELHVQLKTPKSKQSQKTQQANSNTLRIEELRKILQEKMETLTSLKDQISERKNEIKNIGQQIDKDLNKTLLKTKPNAVNIRDIFSAPPKSNNKVVNELNQQLKNIRLTIKKTKTEIQKLANNLMDPIVQLNQQKGCDFENRIKSAEEELKHIQKQKELLAEEINRGGMQWNQEEEKAKGEEITKLNTALAEIIASQKQYKGNIYQIQKEDILLMEKVKFFQQRQGVLGHTKKSKLSVTDASKLQEQIREALHQVNEIMEERNRVQGEKKTAIKNLTNQIAPLQTKNWNLCSKLREIDSFLLQYYDKKSKKKELKVVSDRAENKSDVTVMQKSVSGKIQSLSMHVQQANKTIDYQNDKNKKIVADVVLVEKKKVYQFVGKEDLQQEIQISDQFLGNKLNISKIILTANDQQIYSVQAVYEIFPNKHIEGYCMGSKDTSPTCKRIQITLDRSCQQIINFIHIGYSQDHSISFFHLTTTEGKEHKWGNPNKAATTYQKHIKKYQFCFLKTKLIPKDNLFCISGVFFSTIYLGTK